MKMVFPDPADVLNFTLALTPDEGEWEHGRQAMPRRFCNWLAYAGLFSRP